MAQRRAQARRPRSEGWGPHASKRHAKTGQEAVVLFVSGLDPSGLDLQRAWEDALRHFGAPVAKFVRIGLNRDQVDALDNPVLRQGIEVKEGDSRADSYRAEFGDRCWETDILRAATAPRPCIAQTRPREIRTPRGRSRSTSKFALAAR
jgi:hypothetical protein